MIIVAIQPVCHRCNNEIGLGNLQVSQAKHLAPVSLVADKAETRDERWNGRFLGQVRLHMAAVLAVLFLVAMGRFELPT